MNTWKLPPRAKIFEALTAVADGRVKIRSDLNAEVVSSNREKTYTVEWSKDGKSIASNDNASYWQGYMGYPILAVLMVLGKIKINTGIAQILKGIEWNTLNKQFKRQYDKVIEVVVKNLEEKDISQDYINSEIDQIMEQVKSLNLKKIRSRKFPP